MPAIKKTKNTEDWKKFLPRGTKRQLAEKYGLTTMAVAYILKREDVLNHSELMSEARKIAMHTMKEIREHDKDIKILSHQKNEQNN